MNRIRPFLFIGPVIFACCSALGGDDRQRAAPPGSDFTIVTVDFSPLAKIPGNRLHWVDLSLRTRSGNGSYRMSTSFSPDDGPRSATEMHSAGLMESDYTFDQKDQGIAADGGRKYDRLIIFGHTEKDGSRSGVIKVGVSSLGTFPIDFVPTIIASDGAEIDRNANGPLRKGQPKNAAEKK